MRAWHKLTIVIVVLVGLLVAADRIAVGVAEDKVAERIQTQEALNTKPKVSIEGFPFLTQVVARKLDSVRLSADGLQVSGGSSRVTLQTFSAHLTGVRVNSDFSSATADSATGTGVISYADLTSLIGNNATLSYGGDGKIKVSGKVNTASLGLPIDLGTIDGSATARLVVSGGNTIQARDISVNALGAGIDIGAIPGLENVFSGLLKATRVAGLPVGLSLDAVQPQADGVAITMTGRNLNLAATGATVG